MKTNKIKHRLTDRPLFGAFLVLASNILAVVIVFILNSFTLFTSRIPSNLFELALVIFMLVILIMNVLFLMTYIKKNRLVKNLFILFQVIFLLCSSVAVFAYYNVEATLNNALNQNLDTSTQYTLISLNTSTNAKENVTIGIPTLTESIKTSIGETLSNEGYDYTMVQEASYSELLTALFDKDVQYIIMAGNYADILSDEQELLDQMTSVLEIQITAQSGSSGNILDQPFTMALFGTNEGLPDSIMVLSFNPQTLKITITSIPRDSYVPITCYGDRLDKLNHSASVGGLACTIETIENMLDITIDYYTEVNFNAIVALVDAMGGLEVTVDHRIVGDYSPDKTVEPLHTVVVPEGTNVLNGEQVLTFVRERYSYAEGDFARQKNQQYVLQLMVAKLMSLSDINSILTVIDTMSTNINTSIDKDDMITLLSFGLEQTQKYSSTLPGISVFRIEQSRITGVGDGPHAYSPLQGSYASVVYVYKQGIEDAHDFITGNLATVDAANERASISFDINEPYEYPKHFQVYYSNTTYMWE